MLVLIVIGWCFDVANVASTVAVALVGSSVVAVGVGTVHVIVSWFPTTVWFCRWVARVPILCSQRQGATYLAAGEYQVLLQTLLILEGVASPAQCAGWELTRVSP